MSNGSASWIYGYSDAAGTRTTTATDPLSHTRVVTSLLADHLPRSDTDGAGNTTSYGYDGYGRLTSATAPEGNYVTYSLDLRGNVTQTVAAAKPGSGAPALVSYASFDAACANAYTCNKPNSTTDPRGNTTDYAYDPSYGVPTQVQQPAPESGAARPAVAYAFTAQPAAGGSTVLLPAATRIRHHPVGRDIQRI